jgi:antitoxin CcdA
MRMIYAGLKPHISEAKLSAPARRAANVTLDSTLLAEAKELDVNISRAAETGLSNAVRKAKGEQWLAENRAALESSNE